MDREREDYREALRATWWERPLYRLAAEDFGSYLGFLALVVLALSGSLLAVLLNL
jgi:hypothetical protein